MAAASPARREGRACGGRYTSNCAAQRAVLMLRALGDYTRLMLCPTTLQMDRTLINFDNYRSKGQLARIRSTTEYLSILGLLALIGLGAGAVVKGRGQSYRLFGAAWFLLTFCRSPIFSISTPPSRSIGSICRVSGFSFSSLGLC